MEDAEQPEFVLKKKRNVGLFRYIPFWQPRVELVSLIRTCSAKFAVVASLESKLYLPVPSVHTLYIHYRPNVLTSYLREMNTIRDNKSLAIRMLQR